MNHPATMPLVIDAWLYINEPDNWTVAYRASDGTEGQMSFSKRFRPVAGDARNTFEDAMIDDYGRCKFNWHEDCA